MKENDSESDEDVNEIKENDNITSNSSFKNSDINIANNNKLDLDDKKLPLLKDKISIIQDKENIKPPIYLDELVTRKKYDDIDIKSFSDIISNMLVEIKDLIKMIENNFSKKNEKLFELINKYKIPYLNFFYSLLFLSKELFKINNLVQFKYSENINDINEYNKQKQINLEDFEDINEYINKIKRETKLFNDFEKEEQIE